MSARVMETSNQTDHEGERLAEHEGTRTGVTPKPEQPVLNERAQAFAITPRQKMHSNAEGDGGVEPLAETSMRSVTVSRLVETRTPSSVSVEV